MSWPSFTERLLDATQLVVDSYEAGKTVTWQEGQKPRTLGTNYLGEVIGHNAAYAAISAEAQPEYVDIASFFIKMHEGQKDFKPEETQAIYEFSKLTHAELSAIPTDGDSERV